MEGKLAQGAGEDVYFRKSRTLKVTICIHITSSRMSLPPSEVQVVDMKDGSRSFNSMKDYRLHFLDAYIRM